MKKKSLLKNVVKGAVVCLGVIGVGVVVYLTNK